MEDRIWKSGIMGVLIGDALGVPVEYSDRSELKKDPVREMREPGVYKLPAGCWSDDGCLTLAAMKSLYENGYDESGRGLKLMMEELICAIEDKSRNPMGKYMSVGSATLEAMERYKNGMRTSECGGKTDRDNGNGSLMRILPACIYFYQRLRTEKRMWCKPEIGTYDYLIYYRGIPDVIRKIEAISSLTHAHMISTTACGIYYFLVEAVLNDHYSNDKELLKDLVRKALDRAILYYSINCTDERRTALLEFDWMKAPEDLQNREIFADDCFEHGVSAYVADTLRAVVYCLMTTESFEECLLKIVNLGGDTDTTAAIAGGIAGLYYGYDSIPENWLAALQRREEIEKACEKMDGLQIVPIDELGLPFDIQKSFNCQYRWEDEYTFHDTEYIKEGGLRWFKNLRAFRDRADSKEQLLTIMESKGYGEWAEKMRME